jgi:hypothetical protein
LPEHKTLERRVLAYLAHHGPSVIPWHICGGRRLMFLPAALMVLRADGLIEADGERYALTDAGRTVAEGVPEYALARYTAS